MRAELIRFFMLCLFGGGCFVLAVLAVTRKAWPRPRPRQKVCDLSGIAIGALDDLAVQYLAKRLVECPACGSRLSPVRRAGFMRVPRHFEGGGAIIIEPAP